MKLPLSLVVITLNEENNIARCLQSAPWADDIVVLDSGSTDRTVQIAAKLGARVFTEPWRGFGPQKRRATELARHDWILSLDGDEAISPELAAEILQKFSTLEQKFAYRISRKSFYLGRWILHGGWFPDYQTRLFHRSQAQWSEAIVHERVEAQNLRTLDNPIEHFVFRNIQHHMQTNDRYSSLQAQEAFAGGKCFSLLKMIVKPWSKFIECYFLKAGFLDGLPGFFIAVSAAYSVFMRWGKIWELQHIERKTRT